MPALPQSSNLASNILTSAVVLALLYFGREILIPVTLAVILSFLMAPLVRSLRGLGIGRVISVPVAVILLALAFLAMATIIGSQIIHMVVSLPQYEKTIKYKIETLRHITLDRVDSIQGQAGRIIDQIDNKTASQNSSQNPSLSGPVGPSTPIPVEVHNPPANNLEVVTHILSSIWIPIETTGIVVVVLIFILFEQDALRDRFIRLVGVTDIRRTTAAIDDVTYRLSRYFVSQFAVNFSVGGIVWIGLAIIGLPHATSWGFLTATLRFIPYIGVWFAGILAVIFASAVEPGWSIMMMTFGLYVATETIVAQLVEPHLYGHSTGLSPLSVVISAIFWSWIWGPIGLIVSTPLTLCLVVAGQHIKALNFLYILLGNTPALTLPQKLYQRALAGDSGEIIADAREFLKRNSFAVYCDSVLMSAIYLARLDFEAGTISKDQQIKVRNAVAAAIEALDSKTRQKSHRLRRNSVLNTENIGQHLRHQRELLSGQWQGPLQVPPGSIILCVGLGSVVDDLATEIMVRILRDQNIDARHLSLEDIKAEPPPGASRESISIVNVVSTDPVKDYERAIEIVNKFHVSFPNACIVNVSLPGPLGIPNPLPLNMTTLDKCASSFEEVLNICQELHFA